MPGGILWNSVVELYVTAQLLFVITILAPDEMSSAPLTFSLLISNKLDPTTSITSTS
jgi:hypothetical protein